MAHQVVKKMTWRQWELTEKEIGLESHQFAGIAGHIQCYCPRKEIQHKATTAEEKSPGSDHSGEGAFVVSHNYLR